MCAEGLTVTVDIVTSSGSGVNCTRHSSWALAETELHSSEDLTFNYFKLILNTQLKPINEI